MSVSALLLSNCSNEEIMEQAPAGNVVVSATMESGDAARSNVDDDGYFTWLKGDEIAVYTTNESSRWAKFTLQGEGGSAEGSFSGSMVGDGTETSTCAVYPYNGGQHTLDGNELTFHLPESYDYKEGNTNAPMLALIAKEGSTDFPFKHLGGVLRFKLNNVPAKTTQFVFTTSHQITGNFTVADINADGAEISTPAAPISSQNTVTINMTALEAPANKIFYIPMPVGTYDNMKIELKDGAGNVLNESSTTKPNTISRRTLLRMPTITCTDVQGSIVANASDITSLNKLLSEAGSAEKLSSVTLSGEGVKNITEAITIPETYTNAGDGTPKVLNLTFDDVPATSTQDAIKIEDGNSGASTAEQSKAKVEVAIPAASDEKAPSFDINLPTATVTLAATGESAIYNKVTASTATNTLIIANGVTVKDLIVKGGNVRVNEGGIVSAITRDASNQEVVTIYKEEGATLPDNFDDSAFKVVDAAVAELEEVAQKGGTYTLTTNLVGNFTISATDEVIINLNGHTITNKSGDTFTVNYGSTLTINGTGTVDNVTHQMASIYNNGTVTLNGGAYTRSQENGQSSSDSGNNSFYTILNHGVMTINSTVEVSQNGHFSSTIDNGYYSYNSGKPRDGYVSGTNHQNPSLTINGGTFTGGLNTVKNDDNATLTIKGGTFSNVSQATVQNHHVTKIEGGTFTGTGKYVIDNEGHGGAEVDLGQMTISGGTFDGKIYQGGTGASLTVTGGTFSDPNVLTYLGENANVTVKLKDDTELEKPMIVEKGTATIDLDNHTLTAAATATIKVGKDRITTIAVKDGAKATVKNGTIAGNTNDLWYGVYAYGKADVTLNKVNFSEQVTYAYNGAGTLAATDCTFRGWLSGWHHGATFEGCTFTIGKSWYPAAICYGSTTFTGCKFFKNDVDADIYDNGGAPDNDGYYRCCYVVAQCEPSQAVGFTDCIFIDESNQKTGDITTTDHPFHACGWGDGTAAEYNVTVGGAAVTSHCSDAKASDESK